MLELSCGDLCGVNKDERVCELPCWHVSDKYRLIKLLKLPHRVISFDDWRIPFLELLKLFSWHLRVNHWHQRLLELFTRNISREQRLPELFSVLGWLLLGLGCERVFNM